MTGRSAKALSAPDAPSWYCAADRAASVTQSPRPMGIVDLLNVPRLGDPQLSPDGRDVALHAERRRLEERPPRLAHLARAGGRRRSRVQLTSGAEGENAPALVARRQDDRVHREARRQRVRADLPAAGRRRRGAPADDARERGLRHRRGRPTAPRCTSPRPSRRRPTRRRASKAEGRRLRVRRELQADAPVEGRASRPKAETRITTGDYSVTAYDLSGDGRKIALPPRADAAARRSGDQRRSVG